MSSKTELAALKARIPRPAKVGSLSGLGGGKPSDHRMTKYCKGTFAKSPYTMEKIQYKANSDSDTLLDGVAAADEWARETPGKKIIFGMSQGSQVIADLLIEWADDPTAPSREDVVFVAIGNPRDSWNGYAASEGVAEFDGGIAQYIRVDTGYTLVQGKIRYDGWADWPNDTSNSRAVLNANLGKFTRHNKYQAGWDLFDVRNTVWRENENTFHVLSPADMFYLPQYDSAGIKPVACVKAARLARVEKAYNRHPNDPPIVVPKPRNWIERTFMKLEGLDEYIK